MEITFALTPDDLLKYNLYFQRVSASGRSQRRRVILALFIVAIAGVLVAGLLGDVNSALVVAPIAVVVIALSPLLQRVGVRRAIRRLLRDPRLQGQFGQYRVDFSQDGFVSKSPVAETKVPWTNVREIVHDGDDYLYVCLISSAASIIHRTSSRGPVTFDQLADELERLRTGR